MGAGSASRGGIIRACACVLWALAACSVDAPDDSFGMITAGPAMTAATMPTGGGGDDDGSGSADDDGGSGSAADDDGGSASGSTGAGDGDTTAGETGGGAGVQPQDGIYSACASAVECVGATYCIPAGDGFCTSSCTAPADCAPSPNGMAPTACIPLTMPATSVCALDCSGGQTCPSPMECAAVEGSMVCV